MSVYVGWWIFVYIVGFATSLITTPSSALIMIPGLAIFIAVAVILFQPKANEYFSAGSRQNDVRQIFMFQELSLRKVINVICYILVGGIFTVTCHLAFLKLEFGISKFVVIGVVIFFALVPLLVGLWLSGFHKWMYYMGIVLLSVAGFSMLRMLSTIWLVVPPEVEAYLPPGTKDLSADYFAGTVWILVLCFAGILLFVSGRKLGLNRRSDQSSLQEMEATGFRSTGNGGKVMQNLQSTPKAQSDGHLSVRGASILAFSPESSARKAGMHKGDVIIEYASERDITIEKLSAVTAKKAPEAGQVRVVFVRDGQQHSRMLPSGPLGISVINTTINVPVQSK
jgi:hypothetical protein